MKTIPLAGLLTLALLSPTGWAQTDPAPAAPVVAPAAADEAWSELSAVLATARQVTRGEAAVAAALQTADRAKVFHTQYAQHGKAVEARKLEAIFLIDAVAAGGESSRPRMEAAVRTLRDDKSVPAFDRAVVAGTHAFGQIGRRAKTQAEAQQEFTAVSRELIQEFPDQPQGYVSLLTQALQHDDPTARAMAKEVVDATAAPPEARERAQRLVARLDLIGAPVETIFGETPLSPGGKAGWPKNRAGLVYFWAPWSPPSLALGEMLAGRKLAGVNVVGVCLDADQTAAAEVARSHQLPGQLVYVPDGLKGDLAARLGADGAPLLYLVDANGRFTDVRGLRNLATKLEALGL